MSISTKSFTLTHDGALTLRVAPELTDAVNQWLPFSAHPTRESSIGATIEVRKSTLAIDDYAPVMNPSPYAHPTLRLGDVSAWVDDARAHVVLWSSRGLRGQIDLSVHKACIYVSTSTIRDLPAALTLTTALVFNRLGRALVHAAAVVPPSGAAWLLVGDSHAGKTTTTVNLSIAGWQYLSDDNIVLIPGVHAEQAQGSAAVNGSASANGAQGTQGTSLSCSPMIKSAENAMSGAVNTVITGPAGATHNITNGMETSHGTLSGQNGGMVGNLVNGMTNGITNGMAQSMSGVVSGGTISGVIGLNSSLTSSGFRRTTTPAMPYTPPAERILTAEGWPRTFHLDPGWRSGTPCGGRREDIDPRALLAGRWRHRAPVAGLLFPTVVADAQTHLEPVSRGEALALLLRQSPWLLADRTTASGVLLLLTAAAELPAYRLTLGLDTYQDLDRLTRCLDPLTHAHAMM
jgi:hypothetical protein